MIIKVLNSDYSNTGLGQVEAPVEITQQVEDMVVGFSAITEPQKKQVQIFVNTIGDTRLGKLATFQLPKIASGVDEAFYDMIKEERIYPAFYDENSILPSNDADTGFWELSDGFLKVADGKNTGTEISKTLAFNGTASNNGDTLYGVVAKIETGASNGGVYLTGEQALIGNSFYQGGITLSVTNSSLVEYIGCSLEGNSAIGETINRYSVLSSDATESLTGTTVDDTSTALKYYRYGKVTSYGTQGFFHLKEYVDVAELQVYTDAFKYMMDRL